MTDFASVDEQLQAWTERLRRVDENLLELEADTTYQVLAGGGGKPAPLEGITQERVRPALDAMMTLFEQREKITRVLERAREIRASMSSYALWGTEDKLAEIDALLHGPSISMGQEVRPLAERNLLDIAAREVSVVPEELLTAMVRAFEVARDAVIAVRKAWSKLEPAMEETERDLALLKTQSERAGIAIPPELRTEVESLERELSVLRRAVACDPLGVEGAFNAGFRSRLLSAKKQLDEAIGAGARVVELLASAKALRREIDLARAEAQRAIAQIAHDFEPFVEAPRRHAVDDAALAELDVWHHKLEATVLAGNLHRAEIGIARYLETAKTYRDAELAIAAARDTLASRRAELIGRHSARNAQLDALRARGVTIPTELEKRGREANAILGTRPFPFDAATSVVDSFEVGVVALTRNR